ncbi:MAG: hypothetical protein IJI87_01310 [Mogibacterium sp.]|nr:hypothetical protein [Mogibacterium sp.]
MRERGRRRSRIIGMLASLTKELKMNNTDRLKESLEKCGCIGAAVIGNRATGREYVRELLALLDVVKEMTEDEIKSAGYPANIENTIRMDKYLVLDTVIEEFDQLSLLSTLATYVECNKEGRPGHSAAYMDRVTALRKVIEEVYGTEAMRFCGSDGC